MMVGIENLNVLDFEAAKRPSPLEEDYIRTYGQEFVDDLKRAYHWMKRDMQKQPPAEEVARRRRRTYHEVGEWFSVFYVDFRNEIFYSQIIDDMNGKTVDDYGRSPCLNTEDNHNVRFLLSGLYLYDKNRAKKWATELLGDGEKFWIVKM